MSAEGVNMDGRETATLGGGCFWCLEAVYEGLQGVISVESGYCGGETRNPTYEDVCGGETGHAEVVRVIFDPAEIGYADILDVFFAIHDPTTYNRQGNDIGPQYRSVIYYHDQAQKQVAEKFINDLTTRKIFKNPIVTAIDPLKNYYPAEAYHQRYFENNPMQPYCAYVVAPKVEKAEDLFRELFKR